ncbi:hypothetical protein CLAIMM_03726 [Cladophialophora immunda]|nr:hypothetical protein CLAIMM_03726 [Cladophialophora immunda]
MCLISTNASGLGNRNANAIPLCQLCRLQCQVNALFDASNHPVPFWIDTICVPLEQPERNQAIIAMRRIYTEATKVLVVDNVLSEVSSTESLTNLILRVRASTWMTRLWTYHEARLARSLHYQFRDKPLTVDEMLAQHKKAVGPVCASEDPVIQLRMLNLNPLVAYNVDHVTRVQKFASTVRSNDPRQEDAVALAHVTSHIRWRRTSRPIDEAICLAGVMNRRFDDLVVLDTGSERIKQLVSTLRGVPTDILFVDRPRIEEEGCRWMTSTFLGDEQAKVLMDPARRGTPSKDGLLVRMPCVVLEPGNMGRCENVDVEGGSECIYISQKASRLPNPYPHPNGERTWRVTVSPSPSESITRGPSESPSCRWHILRSASLVLVLQQSLTDSKLKQVRAVVASVKRTRIPDGLVFCRYEFQASVQLVSRRVEGGAVTKLKMYPSGKNLCVG